MYIILKRQGVNMDKTEIQKLDNLTLELNMNLCILKSAVTCFDDDLEVSDLIDFTERIYITSVEIRDIFDNS